MIEAFDKIPISDKVLDLNLKSNDTLVVKINQDIWDIEEAHKLVKLIAQNFPKNNIITVFNGVELGVIHNED